MDDASRSVTFADGGLINVHYATSSETGYTLCGRRVTMGTQVTREPAKVTCSQCLASAEGVTS